MILKYIKNHCPSDHDPTVEDSYKVMIETEENEKEEFEILDTAGEEDYQNMLDNWIKKANGFLLIFAINDSESFDAIKLKIKRIEKNEAFDLPIILVGNKCDLEDKRTVSVQQATELAKSINGIYYETSALNDFNGNVKTVFTECAKKILTKDKRERKKKCFCIIF